MGSGRALFLFLREIFIGVLRYLRELKNKEVARSQNQLEAGLAR